MAKTAKTNTITPEELKDYVAKYGREIQDKED